MTSATSRDAARANPRWVAPIIASVPILELYASPAAKVSWGGVALGVLSVAACVRFLSGRASGAVIVRLSPIVFVVVLAGVTALGAIIQYDVILDTTASVRRLVMMLLWAVAVSIGGAALCRPVQMLRWVQRIALVGTAYLLGQWVAWHVLGVFLPSVIDSPFFHPLSEGYADIGRLQDYYRGFYFRPASFFAEPQYYSDYASLALILSLFGPDRRLRGAFSVFLSIGLVVSTSTTGIIVGTLIWGFYFLRHSGTSRSRQWQGSLVFLVIPLLMVAYSAGLLRSFFKIDFSKLASVRTSGRVGGSFDLLGQLHGTEAVLGIGIGNERWLLGDHALYFNSVTAIGLGAGVVGLVAVFGLIAHLYTHVNGPARLLLTVYVLLSIGGSMLYSERSVLWLWFVLYGARLFGPADSISIEDGNRSVREKDVLNHGWDGVVRNDDGPRVAPDRLRRDPRLFSG